MHKRRVVLMIITVLAVILFSACKTPKESEREKYRENSGDFSVHYLDVGQGDSALIYFPDGKTMLIDAGNGAQENNRYILEFLSDFGVDKIDYLVLTHPDEDHIGGAKAVIENMEIGLAYVPFVPKPQNFLQFEEISNALDSKGVERKISGIFESVKGADYTVAFILPYPPELSESSYHNLYLKYPSESDINNVSPYIYVEYKGARFLFTGDADALQEKILVSEGRILISLFSHLDVMIDLENIDFLKVSHHGAEDGTSEQFLQMINPKNSVISVGGENKYGLPSSKVISRLKNIDLNHKIYRTDVEGTISVTVSDEGNIAVVTDNA